MTSQLVYQRIRNRLIELLEWMVEFDATSPRANLNELINSWDDWVPSPLSQRHFCLPVFTPTEAEVLQSVSTAVDALCAVTPGSIDDQAAAVALPQWDAVIAAVRPALVVMSKRGRLSEEREEPCL